MITSITTALRWRKRKTRGFTLVEMLVTVSIIAILAALCLKGVGSAMAWSQASKCASNLRQISVAAQAWSADNDGAFVPFASPDQDFYYGPCNWTGLLAPYMNVTLPSGRIAFTSTALLPAAVCPLHTKRWGYGQNLSLSGWTGQVGAIPAHTQPVKTGRITDLSNMIYFTDCATSDLSNEWKDGTWRPFSRPPYFGKPSNPGAAGAYFGHQNNTANVLWADGHVTAEKESSPCMTDVTQTNPYWYPPQ